MSRARRLRGASARLLDALADELRPPGKPLLPTYDPRPFTVSLNHPPTTDLRPRWGHGRPPHRRILSVLEEHHDDFREALRQIAGRSEALVELAPDDQQAKPGEPHWQNPWLPALDVAALYTFIRDRRPARYVEIGSGHSTMVARRAVDDGDLGTEIVSIDPSPRAEIDALCHRIHRVPFEQLAPDQLQIGPGDLVFFDGSHRAFTSSDVVIFQLEVLPGLPSGVLVGVHDIMWPDDYLPEWRDAYYSEQYLLGAYLLGRPSWLRPVLAAYYASTTPDLAAIIEPLWERLDLPRLDRRGFAFWFETQGS